MDDRQVALYGQCHQVEGGRYHHTPGDDTRGPHPAVHLTPETVQRTVVVELPHPRYDQHQAGQAVDYRLIDDVDVGEVASHLGVLEYDDDYDQVSL